MRATAGSEHSPLPGPTRLTVLTDEWCGLCRRCRAWLADQPLLVEVEFLAAGSDEALRRYGPEMGQRLDELVVADEHGRIWTGPDAFVMCLWASADHRGWARWSATPGWRLLARALFAGVSSNRHRLAELMDGKCVDGTCSVHGPPPPPRPSPSPPSPPPPPPPSAEKGSARSLVWV